MRDEASTPVEAETSKHPRARPDKKITDMISGRLHCRARSVSPFATSVCLRMRVASKTNEGGTPVGRCLMPLRGKLSNRHCEMPKTRGVAQHRDACDKPDAEVMTCDEAS